MNIMDLLKGKEKTQEEIEHGLELKKIEIEEQRKQDKITAREKVKIKGEEKRSGMKKKKTTTKEKAPGFNDLMDIKF